MSSIQQSGKQTAQDAIMNAPGPNNESTEAKTYLEPPCLHSDPQAAKESEEPFHDSGCFDGEDSTSYEYAGDKDFILFNDTAYSEDYILTEEDAFDIASTKANHGSVYNKTIKSTTSQIKIGTSYEGDAYHSSKAGKTVYDIVHEAAGSLHIPEEEPRPTHVHSKVDQTSSTPFHSWTNTFERHESIAYRFEQPPNPSHVFQYLQTWDEDIDLSQFQAAI